MPLAARVIESLRRLFPLEQLYVVRMEDDGPARQGDLQLWDVLTPEQRRGGGFRTPSDQKNPNSIFVHAALQLEPAYIRRLVRPPLGRKVDIDRSAWRYQSSFSGFFHWWLIGNRLAVLVLLNYSQEPVLFQEDIELIPGLPGSGRHRRAQYAAFGERGRSA